MNNRNNSDWKTRQLVHQLYKLHKEPDKPEPLVKKGMYGAVEYVDVLQSTDAMLDKLIANEVAQRKQKQKRKEKTKKKTKE